MHELIAQVLIGVLIETLKAALFRAAFKTLDLEMLKVAFLKATSATFDFWPKIKR